MTDNTDGFDTGIGIEEETGPESGMPSEGPDMTRDRPALFDGDTGDMPLEARMAAIALKRERYIVDWQRCVGQVLRGRVPVR